MIGSAIRAMLLESAAVASLVDQRIYPLILRQHATMDAITYRFQEDQADITFDGQGQFQQLQAEIDCWADDYDSMQVLSSAVKAALKNYSGNPAGVEVQQVYVESSVPVYEDASEKYRETVVVTIYLR